MVDALVPATRTLREFGIIADCVDGRLEQSMLPWLGVLRHEKDVTFALVADLVDELGETCGIGHVDVAIGLDAMTVAAGDEKHVPLLGKATNGAVFSPVAQAIEFKGVEEGAVFLQEFVDEEVVLLLP